MGKLGLAAMAIALVAALLVVAGCGGGGVKTQNLTSPYNGFVYGVDTEPPDDDVDVATDSWIHVFWPDSMDFAPPREFTVTLEKEQTPGNWGTVHTNYRRDWSDPNGASWWFEPVNPFSPLTNYRIVITDVNRGDTAIAYFTTADIVTVQSKMATPSSKGHYRPKGAENAPALGGPGELEHKIKVR